ncbi:MAG: GTPase HflX [Chloroflexi bacterium]|nr:MAG: GTPase HflX [Chloroflexota bacterium]
MAKKSTEPTTPPRERAFLVGVELRGEPALLPLDDSLAELALLAETADLEIVGETSQKLDKPNPETYIGSGKVEELKILVEETLADLVIFDSELSPRHQRELEEKFGDQVRILDRTALILDIFAQHADTREGILQVELAYYEYRLPRLTRAWTHLARQAGGGGGRTGSTGGVGLRGPGETQLEVDRREIHKRITHLKGELEKVRAHRHRYREQRRRSNVPTVALVGYTNAGKSTLLNKLARSDVYVANQLFATLDPTTRRVELPAGHTALFTDTVGFIQKLPTMLVAAFRATLEEINEADLLLHVLDVTHPNALEQWQSVQETLVDIGAQEIPMVTALNKIDLLASPEMISASLSQRTPTIPISALTGQGAEDLLRLIEGQLFENYTQVTVHIPYRDGQLISLFHEQGKVESTKPVETYITIKGMLPTRMLFHFRNYMKPPVELDQGAK